MSERRPFALRCPNGPNMGKYFASGDYRGIRWTEALMARRVSVRDAYGHIAAALDMLCEVLVPESDGTADAKDFADFAKLAAGNMFQSGGVSLVPIIEKAIRREATDPLFDHPQFHQPHKDGYMSVWEWVLRVDYRGGELDE